MAYETRDNTGVLFRNEKKEQETHADYNGTAMVDGVEYYMNAWLKDSSSGKKFFSFSFRPKAAAGSKSAAKPKAAPQQDLDDDLPF